MITISAESPLTEDGRTLVAESQEALLRVYPPEEIFSFSAEELAGPETRFLVARGPEMLGCVALVDQGGYGEIKRLYVRDTARGRGVGRRLMQALEEEARAQHLPLLRAETGEALVAACALYRAMGFRECGPFGGYPDIPSNLFLEKPLSPAPQPVSG